MTADDRDFARVPTNGTVTSAEEGRPPAHGTGPFIADLVTLAELQVSLTMLDLKDMARRVRTPLMVVVVCLSLMAGCVPPTVFAIALLLSAGAGISVAWSLLIVVGAVASLLLPLIVFGITGLGGVSTGFRASGEELEQNLEWLRRVLGEH